MKLRHKILAYLLLPFKPLITRVMTWYAQRKMRQALQDLPTQEVEKIDEAK